MRIDGWLQICRWRAGMTQQALAAAAGVSSHSVGCAERGRSVSFDMAMRIGQVLGIEAGDLQRPGGPAGVSSIKGIKRPGQINQRKWRIDRWLHVGRVRARMLVGELATRAGIPHATMAEASMGRGVSAQTAEKLASVLGVNWRVRDRDTAIERMAFLTRRILADSVEVLRSVRTAGRGETTTADMKRIGNIASQVLRRIAVD
jgi:transcriptional regulator with XRE-family HTH domain